MGNVLNRFAQQAGIAISFSADDVAGIQAAGLEGDYQIDAAFAELLQGSGLFAQPTPSGYVVRSSGDATMLAPVKIQADAEITGTADEAYRVENVSIGVLGNRSLKDTPYSIEAYPQE